MNYKEFLKIINDDKFNKIIYDNLIKDYGFGLISKYFSKLLNSDLSEEFYDKCKYYMEDDMNNNIHDNDFSNCKDLSSLKQYLDEIAQIPLLDAIEEKDILIRLDNLKHIKNDYEEKYNIKELIDIYGESFDNLTNIKDENIKVLKKYLETIKEYEVLSKKLIESNLRLVVSIAKHYANNSIDILDLIQEGNIGIKMAIDKFDIEKGNKFSTYAIWWIRHHIINEIHTHSRTIKLPVNKHEFLYKINKVINMYQKEYCKVPNNEEIIEYIKIKINEGVLKNSKYFIDLKPETLEDLKKITQNITSLNMNVGDGEEEAVLEDFIVDKDQKSVEEIVEKNILMDEIKTILDIIEPRFKLIIILRFELPLNKYMEFDEFLTSFNELKYDEIYYKKLYFHLSKNPKIYTLKQIANLYGITRERIRQLEFKALRTMRNKNISKKILQLD